MTYGMTHTLVQTKLNTLAIEKRDRRKSLYRFVDNVLADSQSCKRTLEGKALSGDTSHPDRSFEIDFLKDATGGTLMDFKKTNGILDDAATKEKLKNLGIDKFDKLEFRYKTALPRTGQVVLISKTVVKGLHEKSNRELIWEISGIKVETKTDSDNNTSEQVTLCQDSVPLRILCGNNVVGTGHLNGGGFVQSTATVDSGAYVSDEAVVCGTAKVKGNAKVFGNAKVKDNAEIKGNALVYENATVSGNAVISGSARVFNSAKVSGSAKVHGSAQVYGLATVEGNEVEIYGNSQVYGLSQIKDKAKVYNSARVYDNAQVYGSANVHGSAQVYHNAQVYDSANVHGRAQIFGSGIVRGTAEVFEDAKISGRGRAQGNAIVQGHASITARGAYNNSWILGRAWVESYVGGSDPNDRAVVGGNVATYEHGVSGKCKCVLNKDTRYGCANNVLYRGCSGTEICGEKGVPYLPLKHKKSPSGSEMNIRNNASRPYTGDRKSDGTFKHGSGNRGYYRNKCTSTRVLP